MVSGGDPAGQHRQAEAGHQGGQGARRGEGETATETGTVTVGVTVRETGTPTVSEKRTESCSGLLVNIGGYTARRNGKRDRYSYSRRDSYSTVTVEVTVIENEML